MSLEAVSRSPVRAEESLQERAARIADSVLSAASRISKFSIKNFRAPDRPSPLMEWRLAVILVLHHKRLTSEQMGEALQRQPHAISDAQAEGWDRFRDPTRKTQGYVKKLCECPEVALDFSNFLQTGTRQNKK